MIKLVLIWICVEFVINIPFIYVYLYILLGVCISSDIWYNTIHDDDDDDDDNNNNNNNWFMILFTFWQLCL